MLINFSLDLWPSDPVPGPILIILISSSAKYLPSLTPMEDKNFGFLPVITCLASEEKFELA